MINNILDNIKFIRYIRGGHWVKTKKRGWITKDAYNEYLKYDFDPVLLKEEKYF